jgi:hypothetical protein
VKLARLSHDWSHADSIKDVAGYAAILSQLGDEARREMKCTPKDIEERFEEAAAVLRGDKGPIEIRRQNGFRLCILGAHLQVRGCAS